MFGSAPLFDTEEKDDGDEIFREADDDNDDDDDSLDENMEEIVPKPFVSMERMYRKDDAPMNLDHGWRSELADRMPHIPPPPPELIDMFPLDCSTTTSKTNAKTKERIEGKNPNHSMMPRKDHAFDAALSSRPSTSMPTPSMDASDRSSSLVSNLIPAPYSSVFQFERFNRVQIKSFDKVFHTNDSIALSAPTGCGKTAIFELAIIKLLKENESSGAKGKAIYMAPMKAIVQEKLTQWKESFSRLGISCLEVTGDSEVVDSRAFEKATVILTTPEKWDSMTRRWRHGPGTKVVSRCRLLMIDEVHLLNEDRGATLEAVVSRMKTIRKSMDLQTQQCANLRFIAVSATVPNISDIGEWLEVEREENILCFGEEDRPVPLNIVVQSFPARKGQSSFILDRNLNYKVSEIVSRHSNDRPVLCFCNSRKGTSDCAHQVRKDIGSSILHKFPVTSDLIRKAEQIKEKSLRELVKCRMPSSFPIISNHYRIVTSSRRHVALFFLLETLFSCTYVPE
jgi:superfamily II RNA helicase